MRVSEVGEFGLIQLLVREFGVAFPPQKGASTPGFLVGLGDDAVVTERRTGALIWTTDTMIAGNHFSPEHTPWRNTGWKSLASNISDIAAMGGTPHLALVTLALPADFCVEDALELYRGLRECATEYGVTLGGGDIVRSPVFSITVALSGWAYVASSGETAVLRRDAAAAGDLVAVSGTPGDSAGGVRLLASGSRFASHAEQRLRDAQQRPRPKLKLGQAAVGAGLRCAIDVSDGLLQDLGHVATASGVAIRVEAAKLPASDALRAVFPDDATELALTGGEDYELVVIGPADAMRRLTDEAPEPVTVIGEVSASGEPGVTVIDGKGQAIEPARRGWDHFRA